MHYKPVLFFYCQHSLGMGHLVRALTLAEALAERFAVVFLNGGRFPENTPPLQSIEVINLPPLGMSEDNQLYSQDSQYSLVEAHALRRQMILTTFNEYQPQVIFIELFPFGRKKFAGELLPLLKAAQRCGKNRPLVYAVYVTLWLMHARIRPVTTTGHAGWLIVISMEFWCIPTLSSPAWKNHSYLPVRLKPPFTIPDSYCPEVKV